MPTWYRALRARPLLLTSTALGVLLALGLPPTLRPVTRALWGWNLGVWSFLAITAWLMARADHERLRRNALLHAEGAATVMAVAACAVVASLAAIGLELSQAKPVGGGGVAWPNVLFAAATVVGSWLLLPVLFTLAYASRYYDQPEVPGGGLMFPSMQGDTDLPDYADFFYFAITVAATSQTSDVAITRRSMRRWVTAQSVLSFAFNTMLLALAVNIAAGLL